MTDLWNADEVRAHLVACASAGQAITYSELLGHLGYAFSRPLPVDQITPLLGRQAKADLSFIPNGKPH